MKLNNLIKNNSKSSGSLLSPSDESSLDWAVRDFNHRVASFQSEKEAFRAEVEAFKKQAEDRASSVKKVY